MNTATQYGPLKAEIRRLLREWEQLLGLKRQGLVVGLRFAEFPHETDESTCADTEFNWHYRQGSITVYLPKCMALHPKALEAVVVHELCHCLLAAMESKVPEKHTETNEYAVESVCKAMLHLRKACGHPDTRKATEGSTKGTQGPHKGAQAGEPARRNAVGFVG